MTNWPAPFSASGKYASVIPLSHDHLEDLIDAVNDGELNQLWYTMIPPADGVQAEIERRLNLQQQGTMLPFSVVDNASGKVIGMTTY